MLPGSSTPTTNESPANGDRDPQTGTIDSFVTDAPLMITTISVPTLLQLTNQQPPLPSPEASEAVNAAFTDMFRRMGLPRPAAVQASRDLWPGRHQGSSDVTIYLEWHKLVRPGGSLHPPTQSVLPASINVRAKSVREIASTLVLMMDHFHERKGNPEISSGDFQAPEGVRCTPIDSLRVFFRHLRGYFM